MDSIKFIETMLTAMIEESGLDQVAIALYNTCARDKFKNECTQRQLDKLFAALDDLCAVTRELT